MSKLTTFLAVVLLLVAGCNSVPPPASRALPPNWDGELGAAPDAAPVVSLPLPSSAPLTNAPLAVSPKEIPAPVSMNSPWVSLNGWAAQNGFRGSRLLPLSLPAAYALTTMNGVFIVRIGSQTAYWDHLDIRLGFAPQLIGDQIYLHPLDVKKTLEPLACGGAVPTATQRVVVIDPGHGGSNPGTRSIVDGRFEKEFTLDWARRLAPLLEQKGWQVFLTRTGDVDVSLPDRTAFADAQHADLFLSLHFNASAGTGDPAGVESYCLTPTGMASSVTRGYNDDVHQVFPNNVFDAENLRYAVRLQRALLEIDGAADRGVRRARYPAVLRGHHRPAVLIEGGYLSNPREARRIADPAYRQKLAEAVAKALAAGLENGR